MNSYDYDPNLRFFQQPKVLRGVYAIVFVSFLLTIFESLFYRFIVQPKTEEAVQGFMHRLQQGAMQTQNNSSILPFPDLINRVDNTLMSYTETMKIREREMIEKINMYAYITASIILLVLAGILYYIKIQLYAVERLPHNKQVFGSNYVAAINTALLTVFMLASFQILFYFFSIQFKFIGSKGEEELFYTMNNGIRRELGMNEI